MSYLKQMLINSYASVNYANIGADIGLSPVRHQAIIWTNARLLLIEPLGTNFSDVLIEIHTFSFKKMRLKMSSEKRRPSFLGLNVLKFGGFIYYILILVVSNSRKLQFVPCV